MSTYQSLPTPLHALFTRSPLPPLRPTAPYDPSLTPLISSLSTSKPPSVISGLHLLNDDIHNSHEVAQANEGDASCDTWHAFLHRREGDYWNSGWWIARLNHPYLPTLTSTTSLIKARASSKAFVAACERVGTGRSASEELEKRQYDELRALCEYDIEKSSK